MCNSAIFGRESGLIAATNSAASVVCFSLIQFIESTRLIRILRIFRHLSEFRNVRRPVVTTGTFDGVHNGHRKILQNLLEVSRSVDGEATLFTFEPHPRIVLHPEDHGLQLLNSPEEKATLLREVGLNNVIIHPFTPEFSKFSAVEYVRDFLVNALGVHTIVIGYDHHFGKNREGDFELLKELAEIYGFEVVEIPAHEIDDCKVSSTKIRNALLEGEAKKANSYLGYNYSILGKVIEGKQLGRKFGFPTANIKPEYDLKLVPGFGVYAVRVKIENEWRGGMLNIGNNPTIADGQGRSIEVNIFDWNDDIYGKTITLEFIDRIRDELKFENTDQLIDEMHNDKQKALHLLG